MGVLSSRKSQNLEFWDCRGRENSCLILIYKRLIWDKFGGRSPYPVPEYVGTCRALDKREYLVIIRDNFC